MEKINSSVFLKVAETGSFRKAAEELGYTQAGISYIIGAMEEETGLTLFVREHGGVVLSPEGKTLLPYFQQIEATDRLFSQAVSELQGLEKGTVKVLIFNSISVHWIPGILSRFLDDYPGIKVELTTEEDSAKAEEMVLNGSVDCAFFLTEVQSDIDVFPLKEESQLAIVSYSHPLAGLEKFPISELGNYPYIAMKYAEHTGINNIFRRHGIKPDTAFIMDNDNAAMAMVSQGLGFSIFAELVLQNVPYKLKLMEFDEPQKRTISIGTRSIKTCSRACRKFIEYTIKWVKENSTNICQDLLRDVL